MHTHIPPQARNRAIAAAALLALAVAACTGGGATASPSGDAASSAPADQSAGPVPTVAPGISEGVPPAVVRAAVSDAAARAGVDPAAVTVVAAEAVTFPNGGLGCPEPGMMYTDVLTPGYRVVVEAGGRRYDYRASTRGGAIRWCENPPPG
jgi:hypothetical protein